MFEPLVSKKYTFQRKEAERVATRTFTRYPDGSAYVEGDGSETIFEGDPLAWQKALLALEQQGFRAATESSI